MRKIFSTATIALGASLLPAVAEANNPPAPETCFSLAVIIPLMMAITAWSGGYVLMQRKQTKWGRALVWAGLLFALFLAALHEGFAFMVIALFGLIVVIRGILLMYYALVARLDADESPWDQARPWRLIVGGATLFVAVLMLVAVAIAFVSYYDHRDSDRLIQDDLERYVRCQLTQATDGLFADLPECNEQLPINAARLGETARSNRDVWEIQFELAADRRSFHIRLYPLEFTPRPFVLLNRRPSYYADQTGRIRKIEVIAPTPCPPDAPIVRTVQAPGS